MPTRNFGKRSFRPPAPAKKSLDKKPLDKGKGKPTEKSDRLEELKSQTPKSFKAPEPERHRGGQAGQRPLTGAVTWHREECPAIPAWKCEQLDIVGWAEGAYIIMAYGSRSMPVVAVNTSTVAWVEIGPDELVTPLGKAEAVDEEGGDDDESE